MGNDLLKKKNNKNLNINTQMKLLILILKISFIHPQYNKATIHYKGHLYPQLLTTFNTS